MSNKLNQNPSQENVKTIENLLNQLNSISSSSSKQNHNPQNQNFLNESLIKKLNEILNQINLIDLENLLNQNSSLHKDFLYRKLPKIQSNLLIKVFLSESNLNHSNSILTWLGFSSSKHISNSKINKQFLIKLAKVSINSIILSLKNYQDQDQNHQNHQIILNLFNLLNSILNQFHLIDWYHSIFKDNLNLSISSSSSTSIQISLEDWNDFLNLLISIPQKLSKLIHQISSSNSSNQNILIQFDLNHFLSKFSLEFFDLIKSFNLSIHQINSFNQNSILPIKPLNLVLIKLINIGFLNTNFQSNSSSTTTFNFFSTIWQKLINSILNSNHHQNFSLWNLIIFHLPFSEMKTFIASLLSHLESNLIPTDSNIYFSTNSQSLDIEWAGAQILKFFFGHWGTQNHLGSIDPYQSLTSIIINTNPWSIFTARIIARWSAISFHHAPLARHQLSKMAMDAFSNQNQISNGSPSHHAFLLVLLLLTASPINSSTTPSPIQISLDPVFIDAIQRSLNSLRRPFRLMGMLMAETLTSFNKSNLTPKLDFGHDFNSSSDKDPDNLICSQIRQLTQNWNPSSSPSTSWSQLLSDLANSQISPEIQFNSNSDPIENHSNLNVSSQSISSFSTTSSISDPPILELSSTLRLSPPTSINRSIKPKIEVLSSHSNSDSLEPYEIPLEDLERLKPSDSFNQSESDYSKIKNKVHSPVYLSELSQYLKDHQNFERIQIGLKACAELIRRKKNWGSELIENSIDLTFSLLNLQDNFDLEGFEKFRQDGLRALIVCAPEKVAPCIIEQIFFHHYTVLQRIGMMNAIAMAACELAELDGFDNTQESEFVSKRTIESNPIHNSLIEAQENHQINDLSIKFNHFNLLSQQPRPKWISQRLLKERQDQAILKGQKANNQFQALGHKNFLIPMVYRMSSYLDESIRLNLKYGIGKPYLGSGWNILLDPILLTHFISTLKILIYTCQKSFIIDNRQTICKECFNLMFKIFQFSKKWSKEDDKQFQDFQSVEKVGLELILILLEGIIENENQNTLKQNQSLLIDQIESNKLNHTKSICLRNFYSQHSWDHQNLNVDKESILDFLGRIDEFI
ncbi:hypothetical protein O181_048810 [Austropuccinia psidii MF-1]|uniref:Telomere length regulation protein conserved domain-containing protein n=1 Tax=Austropuccinia psidii MF-1 TaxID=1389203 RepID=A0A9Q3HPI2_9BASI|nr:hypothetical protein [Austropuccinia psidii MF-1]